MAGYRFRKAVAEGSIPFSSSTCDALLPPLRLGVGVSGMRLFRRVLTLECHSRCGGSIPLGRSAGWRSLVARRAHNPKAAGSNPAPVTESNARWEYILVRSNLSATFVDSRSSLTTHPCS